MPSPEGSGALRQDYRRKEVRLVKENDIKSREEAIYLDEVLALGLRYKWLKLWGCERVDEACLRDDQKEHLSASEDRELVGLRQ